MFFVPLVDKQQDLRNVAPSMAPRLLSLRCVTQITLNDEKTCPQGTSLKSMVAATARISPYLFYLLLRRDNHAPEWVLPLTVSKDFRLILKGEMDDPAFLGCHGRQDGFLVFMLYLVRHPYGQPSQTLLVPLPITLDIDDDALPFFEAAVGHEPDQELQRIKGLTMASDQKAEIGTADIEDYLVFEVQDLHPGRNSHADQNLAQETGG